MDPFAWLKSLLVVASIAGAVVITAWRMREASSAVTARKIVIPPLAMSSGFFMFLAPQTWVPARWAVGALLVGALVLSWPLALTSKLTRVGTEIRMVRSRAFLWVLIGLVAVRFAARSYLETFLRGGLAGGAAMLRRTAATACPRCSARRPMRWATPPATPEGARAPSRAQSRTRPRRR